MCTEKHGIRDARRVLLGGGWAEDAPQVTVWVAKLPMSTIELVLERICHNGAGIDCTLEPNVGIGHTEHNGARSSAEGLRGPGTAESVFFRNALQGRAGDFSCFAQDILHRVAIEKWPSGRGASLKFA